MKLGLVMQRWAELMVESETQFMDKVVEAAHLYHWRCVHFRQALTQSGNWMTPVQFDAKGFVDLVLVRERVIYIELKAEKGRLTPEQTEWIDLLRNAGCEVYMFKPSDWQNVVSILQGEISGG